MWQYVVDGFVCLGSLVAVLDFFGIKPKIGHFDMPVNRKWKLAIMLALVTLSIGLSSYSVYTSYHRNPLRWTMRQDQEELIYGKHYFDQEVELDGKKFDHCSFENVTLTYHATAPVDFVVSTFTVNPGETLIVKTDNDAAIGFLKLATFLRNKLPINNFKIAETNPAGDIINVFDQGVKAGSQDKEHDSAKPKQP